MSNTDKVPEIRKQVVLDASIEKVWQAVASSEGIAAWFMPNDFEPVEGGQFHIKSQFETSLCKVLKINRPTELTFSWGEFGWEVTFLLERMEEKTLFTLIHSGWGDPEETIPGQTRTYLTTRNIMENGWDKLLDSSLRKVVER